MPFPANALEAVLRDLRSGVSTPDNLFTTLADNTLWIPLPAGAGDDGSAQLPIMAIDGGHYVVVYTSDEQFLVGAGNQAHMRMTGRQLAESIPAELGLAINPGCEIGLPVRPDGVRRLRGDRAAAPAGTRVHLGEPAAEPAELLDALKAAFRAAPAVMEARRALARIGDRPPVLLIGIRPDRAVPTWRQDTVGAVQRAAAAHPIEHPVDVVFLDEPDPIVNWMLSKTEPFYLYLPL